MKTEGRRRVKKGERGFALLLIFLLASAVALMLYRQLPREAFESERDKEQILIDRGEQYKRAIYLYYVQNNQQWPTKMEDLESTNSHRYLRHRYIDPYTGKDEWRLIHTNGSFLTDSLVTPPPAQATPGGTPGSAPLGGTGTLAGTSTSPTPSSSTTPATDPNAPPEVNAQVQRRPSDRTLVQNSNFQNQLSAASSSNGDPGYTPFNPAALPPISLYPNGYNATPTNAPGANGVNQPGVNGVNQPGVNQPGVNQPGVNQPGVNQPGLGQFGNQTGVNQPGLPGFTVPGMPPQTTNPGFNPQNPGNNPGGFGNQVGNPGDPNNPPNSNQPSPYQPPNQTVPGQNVNQPFPGQNQQNFGGFNAQASGAPGIPGAVIAPGGQGVPGVPGAPGAPPSNQAVNLINQLLTTPRQPPTTVGQNQPQTGGGLAGVASTYKGVSIKAYADRSKYQEWEFVFKLNPQGTLQPAAQGTGPNGSGGPPTTGQLGTGTSGSTTSGGATSGGAFGGTTLGGTTGGSTPPANPPPQNSPFLTN